MEAPSSFGIGCRSRNGNGNPIAISRAAGLPNHFNFLYPSQEIVRKEVDSSIDLLRNNIHPPRKLNLRTNRINENIMGHQKIHFDDKFNSNSTDNLMQKKHQNMHAQQAFDKSMTIEASNMKNLLNIVDNPYEQDLINQIQPRFSPNENSHKDPRQLPSFQREHNQPQQEYVWPKNGS